MESGFLYDPANASLIAGLILLGLDIVVIGLSPVMFIAVGALLTSAALYATGWRPSLVETAAIVAGASLFIAIVGKKPLQQFQNADVEEDKSSDLIGRDVTMTHEVTKTHGVVFWSGVEWQARLAADSDADSLAPGARARIVAVQNLALVLAPKRD
jgi:membrane protein implicated in regulation of membrane protease activity